jgi:hypothetical protein
MHWSGKVLMVIFACVCWTGSPAWGGLKFDINEEAKGEIGLWTQVWYQHVSDYDTDDDGRWDDCLNDFMTRRAYLYLKGQVTPYASFFTHVAADRIGQDDLDNSSLGLGSGVAWRDLWITLNVHEAVKIQAGRMYVPLTRNYGTTSTKALLTTDLDWTQGGVRGNIFYPSKVGRDDGVCVWGNVMEGMGQYRFMISEGVENHTQNPDDNLRLVGRISGNLGEPEEGWFNQGSYLGKKRVLAIGLGLDYQEDLVLNSKKKNYFVWTADAYYDEPMANGGVVTVEGALIHIQNGPNGIKWTQHTSGDDASILSLKGGYLFPDEIGVGRIQPFLHWEYIKVDERHRDDTAVYGFGCNYFVGGHANKASVDFTYVDQDDEVGTAQEHYILTLQLAVGF